MGNSSLCDTFVEFFDSKVKNILNSCKVEEDVYNTRKKCTTAKKNLTNHNNVIEALTSIKIKNREGYYRIPQRHLNERKEIVINLITKLFKPIFEHKIIP